VRIKEDFIIEYDELVGYESLIRTIQTMNTLRHEIRSLLERSMKEEESMAYWYKIHTPLPLTLDNLWPKIINTS
jgi:hypothetical protein